MFNRKLLTLVLFLLFLLHASCMCRDITYTYNVTSNQPIMRQARQTFTDISMNFPTSGTSGSFEYTDMSRSMKEFENYQLPQDLKDYTFLGIFKMNMQQVSLPKNSQASFTFEHDYSFGILNVNPNQLSIVGLDMDTKKIIQLDVKKVSTFVQQVVLSLEKKIYILALIGIEREITAKFGVPTLVNYRASLKYDLHPNLNQYLSIFVNRELTFPSHEYTAQLVDNQIALPSKQLVEIVSFSFNPMFNQDYTGNMVLNDFQMTFNNELGFVDKNGKLVDVDFNSLQCLYVLDEKKGFIGYSSAVFPGWQILRCSPEVGVNNFFPKYVTIVAALKSNPVNPGSSPNPVHPVNSPNPVNPVNPVISSNPITPVSSENPVNPVSPGNKNNGASTKGSVSDWKIVMLSLLLVVNLSL